MASQKIQSVAVAFSATSAKSSFDLYHAAIPSFFMIAVIVMTMAAIHPILVAMSFVAAIAYSMVLRGVSSAAKMLIWQIPLLLIIALLNPIFSASGSTVMFMIGNRAFYLESLIYGFSTGTMLVAVLAWFSNLTLILNADRILSLSGKVLPTISLMASMIMRLVPQFVKRGSQISDAQKACTAASAAFAVDESVSARSRRGMLDRSRGAARQASTLMEWGMEDSLETADAMRARAYDCGAKRTNYQLQTFQGRDALLLAVMAILLAASIFGFVMIMKGFVFYPVMSSLGNPLLFIPYALFLLVPFVLEFGEWLRWR